MEKLSLLLEYSISIFVIRNKEETRGGEILELTYSVIAGHSDKLCLFVNENITISDMVMEFLDQYEMLCAPIVA